MATEKLAARNLCETLYSDHHGWLQAWLCKRVSTAHDAADLAQDTFVRLLSRPRDLSAIQNPKAFLTIIAKGLMLDLQRRQRLERDYLDALAALPPALHPSPEERCLALEALRQLDSLLDALPPKVRLTFMYSRIDGMKQDDIAQLLGISTVTVRAHLARAMRQWVEQQDSDQK